MQVPIQNDNETMSVSELLNAMDGTFATAIENAIDVSIEVISATPEKRDGLTYAMRQVLGPPTRDYILVKVMAALNVTDTRIRDMPLLKEWVDAIIEKHDMSLTWGRSSTVYDIAWSLSCDPISKKQPIEILADNLKRRIPCVLREIASDVRDLAERWEQFKVSAKVFMQDMNKQESTNETCPIDCVAIACPYAGCE